VPHFNALARGDHLQYYHNLYNAKNYILWPIYVLRKYQCTFNHFHVIRPKATEFGGASDSLYRRFGSQLEHLRVRKTLVRFTLLLSLLLYNLVTVTAVSKPMHTMCGHGVWTRPSKLL